MTRLFVQGMTVNSSEIFAVTAVVRKAIPPVFVRQSPLGGRYRGCWR